MNIKQIMSERNVSQVELHRRSGVSQAHISEIVNGKGSPGILVAQKLAAALGVSITELIAEGQQVKSG